MFHPTNERSLNLSHTQYPATVKNIYHKKIKLPHNSFLYDFGPFFNCLNKKIQNSNENAVISVRKIDLVNDIKLFHINDVLVKLF